LRNAKLLVRTRVNTALSAVYDYPLTILEAPMGYGKTTAAKKFFEMEKLKPFWFTFPDLEYAETAFWNNFTDEISRMDPQAGLALSSLGIPDDAPQMEKVLSTLAGVTFGTAFFMVLDDYHLVRDLRLNKLFLRLAQEELDGLHVLIITRDTSDIDFVELLSRGLCFIISSQQLKFTELEIRDYCRLMHNDISDADLKKLGEYTDGWISFIYIILLGLKNGIPVGINSTIEEIVEKGLFIPYDRETRDFLLKLSVMADFTAHQAAFVTGNENAGPMLKKLNRENAFVFYNEKTRSYKIHSVLLDYLRLKQDFSIEEFNKLYGRLAEWHLEKQEFLKAYGYWNRSGQTERILSHLNDPKNMRNALIKFTGAEKMFDSTPQEMLFQYPLAYLLYLFHSILTGKQNSVLGWKERLVELQRYYKDLDGIDENYRNRVLAETMIVLKFTYFNHLPEMIASDKEIVRLLDGQNSYILLREYTFTLASPEYLYVLFRDAGTLRKLSDMLAEYNEYIKYSNGCGKGGDSLALAEYALETGDFENVEQNSLQAIAKAETMSQDSIIICARFCMIRLRFIQGRPAEALEMLEQLRQDTERINRPIYNTAADLCTGHIYASICQPERIPSWLQLGDMEAAGFHYQGMTYNYLVYGKAVMASKKYEKLEALTGQLKKCFSIYSNQLGMIHNQIFEAAAKCNLYGTIEGATVLKIALNEARADNLIMPFVENSPHIMGMLQLIVQSNPDDEYMNRILTLCRKYERTIQGLSYRPANLSPREIRILTLASEGLSRKEVAERLCISEETAKTHFKNIYQKLDVGSKVLAIKIAQDRGYLEHPNKVVD